MIKKFLAVFALAAMAFVTMPSNEADARRGGGGGGGFRAAGGGGGAFRGGGGGFRSGRVVVRPAFRVGPRIVYGGYRRPVIRRFIAGPVFIVGRRCGWLRKRAIVTGSPYWWRRYRACRLGY